MEQRYYDKDLNLTNRDNAAYNIYIGMGKLYSTSHRLRVGSSLADECIIFEGNSFEECLRGFKVKRDMKLFLEETK